MTRHATATDYARLGLPPSATQAEVKAAFRKLALRLHPDHNPDDPEATKRFKELADSYSACLLGPAPRPNTIAGRAATQAERTRRAANDGHPQMPPQRPAYSPVQHRARREAEAGPRPLATLPIGGVVWGDYSAILVGPDRTVYLDPAAMGRTHVDRGTQVRIERGSEGFRVELPAHCRHHWTVSGRAAGVGMAVTTLGFGDVMAAATGSNPLMPARLIDSTVAKMSDGQRGWTVATALVVVPGGRILIDGEEQVSPEPGLTTPVRVEKRADGWHVTAAGRPQQWVEQGRTPTHRHVDVTSAQLGGISIGPNRPAPR